MHKKNNFIKKLFNLTSIASILLLVGCSRNKQNIIEYHIQDISANTTTLLNNDSAKQLLTKSENIYGFFTTITVIDSLLICGNLRSPKLLSIYSLNGDSLITEVIQRGTAEHEGLSVANINSSISEPSIIWAYDITLAKLFKLNLFKATKDTNYIPEKEITLSKELKNVVSPEIITDSLIIATTYTWDDNRYIYANDSILKKVGTLPIVKNSSFLTDIADTKFPNKAYIFKSSLIKHPFENKVAIFYNKTDRAEFYYNDSLQKKVTGPDNFGPKMMISKLKSGYSIEDFEQTKYAYTSIAYSTNKIYCLYSGTAKDDACSNRIFVFGWDGTFIEELRLNRKVCKICLNPKTNTLYCYDNIDNGIYSVILNQTN